MKIISMAHIPKKNAQFSEVYEGQSAKQVLSSKKNKQNFKIDGVPATANFSLFRDVRVSTHACGRSNRPYFCSTSVCGSSLCLLSWRTRLVSGIYIYAFLSLYTNFSNRQNAECRYPRWLFYHESTCIDKMLASGESRQIIQVEVGKWIFGQKCFQGSEGYGNNSKSNWRSADCGSTKLFHT